MLVITCGYPKSGKSTFVDMMGEHGDIHVVRPSDFEPPEDLGGDGFTEQDWAIAAWEFGLEQVCELLEKKDPRDIIIFDTCGATPHRLQTIMATAGLRSHKVYALWIATPSSICDQRSDPDLIQKYGSKLATAVKYYKENLDGLLVVKHQPLEKWNEKASRIIGKLNASKR